MKDPAYRGCTITNIHRGSKGRDMHIYATLVDSEGKVLISATLDYILEALKERLPDAQQAR